MNRNLALVGWMVTALSLIAASAQAETVELELKTLPSSMEYGSDQYYLTMTMPQHAAMHEGMLQCGPEPEYKSAIEKEPKYTCELPFRGVIKAGSYRYGFACDSTDFKKYGYDRLYLDFNRNRDLTDDKPIKAARSPGVMFGGSYRHNDFPRQTLEIEADGSKFESPFDLNVGSNGDADGKVNYAYLSARNCSYRQGKITVDGKEHTIILLDYNSNGTFNDRFALDENIKMANGALYPMPGDMVVIDPDKEAARYSGYSPVDTDNRHYLSQLLNLDGKFHTVGVTSSGDKLTIEPANLPLGAVKNTRGPYRAVLVGEKGMIKIAAGKDQAVAVPAGQWRLLEYQIDLTDTPATKPASPDANKSAEASKPDDADKPAETAPKEKKSLGQRLAALFGAGDDSASGSVWRGPKFTLVKARATDKGKPVTVAEGKTEALPFGPPYKPVVSVQYFDPGDKEARLDLTLVGVAGEVCENMTIKGQKAPKPSFTIRKKDGELVKQGQFEYG